MENLLPKRTKDIVLIGLAAVIAAATFYLAFFYPTKLDKTEINNSITKNFRDVETTLKKEIQSSQTRAEFIFEKYRGGTLQNSELENKEALIIEENGAISKYFGEIYHFKRIGMDVGTWAFSIKNEALFLAWRLDKYTYYFRYFWPLENNILLKQMKNFQAFSEIKFSPVPLITRGDEYYLAKGIYFYSHLVNNSNGQLILFLKFFQEDIDAYYKKKQKINLCVAFLLLILIGAIYCFKKYITILKILWLASLVDLFFLLPLVGENNLFLKINNIITSESIYQVMITLLFFISIFYYLNRHLKNKIVSFFLFNAALLIIIELSDSILKAVNFNYLNFNLEYLSLISVIFLLHLFPLFFVREIAHEFQQAPPGPKQKKNLFMVWLPAQLVVIVFIFFFSEFNLRIVNIIIMSVIAITLLLFKRGLLSRTAIIFLLAVSSYIMVVGHSLSEQKEFVERNVKDIFLNQSNYAEFISREIVHEINYLKSSDFYDFFKGDATQKLESIWRKTIAPRENIASGIFVVSKEGKVINQFAYRIDFLDVKIGVIFPFWAMEDTTAESMGKEQPVAVAYRGINKIESVQDYKSEYLGYIIVEVLNSPELLLRYQDKINIFTIDKRIDGQDFSYIKLNSNNQILENPSNINLENISGILKNKNRWIEFKYMDMTFKGYIFRQNENSIIVFFPENTLFKDFSGIIKIFIFFALFSLIFYMKDLRKIDWRSIYYSFSIRVFFFLILISLLTAVVFSVFFINFSSKSIEQKVQRMVYENGRIAQNIAYKLIDNSGRFSKNHLFSISTILNGDVSVYDGKTGQLIEPSNYQKWMNSQIPEYLHSKISFLLNDKNQKFHMVEEEGYFNLFFKVYDYIFMAQFSNTWERALSEERYYPDFVITLFFIMFIIGFSSAFFFRNRILSPIEGLSHGMSEVEQGNLVTLKNIPSELEIKTLYQGFNSMIEGIGEQRRSISEISRMKTIIRLGRRVAHEVKNPLTPIKLSAEQILKALIDKNPNYEEIIKQSVNYIIDETDHLKKVSYGFLDLSRMDEINAEEFDMMNIIQDEMFNVRQLYSHIEFLVDVADETDGNALKGLRVKLDKIKIKQVLKNIINNSIEAIGEKKGEIRLSLGKVSGRVLVEVADNGIGMDESESKMLFEEDFSTKEIGTGLGLFIVKRIIELHKGRIEIKSEKNSGTRVILDLPEQV